MTDLCQCETPALAIGAEFTCADCGRVLPERAEDVDAIEAMAWDVFNAWKDAYDGPEGPTLEDHANELYHAIDGGTLHQVLDRARDIQREQSYLDTFGSPFPREGRQPPGFYVHRTRLRRIFPDEPYEETARKDGVM